VHALDDDILDAVDRLAAADRGGLLRAVATAGAQIRESVQLSMEAEIEAQLAGQRPRAVLVAADPGADDVPATIVALAAGPRAVAPVLVQTEPTLPLWVGPVDLLLVAATTGTSERELALIEAADRRGVAVVATGPVGSPLEQACGRSRAPFVGLPPGRPPRASFWGLLTPLLIAAAQVGAVEPVPGKPPAGDLDAAADYLDGLAERCRPTSDTFVNPAKSMALELGAAVPVIWGTSELAGAAAYRAAGQLAGNALLPTVWGTLPVAGQRLGGVLDGDQPEPADFFADRIESPEVRRPRLVLLRDVAESPDVHRTVEELSDELGRVGVPVTQVVAEEAGPVTRFASLVGLLDFASVYAGLARGADPSGVRTGGTPV
jgi:glucose/mannose-6-phosphate isomerase